MKTLMLAAILALVGAALGCEKEKAADAEQVAETAPVNIFEVQTKWVSDFALGSTAGPDGKVTEPKTSFAPGEPIVYSASVADAPPASAVQVRWLGPNEAKLGEQMKLAEGQPIVSFQAPDTSAWAPGQYEAQLWVVDDKVNTQRFEIVAAPPPAETPAKGAKGAKTKK